jgi:branched-chain amino acid aminotransferase
VLPGITRATVIELANELGIPVVEDDIDLFSAATADEIFITSTSLCICPVASLNGIPTGDRAIPGPVTRGLQDAFRELVGVDFVQQYLARLPVAVTGG